MFLALLLHASTTVAPALQDASPRFASSRRVLLDLPLTEEEDAFTFAVFGDRTGGPPEGVAVLAEAVREVNLFGPDLVMTVGDLIQGYNEETQWLRDCDEFREIMGRLDMPWFPVAGNHDIYWRGEGPPPAGEHEAAYERHFGPLWYAFRHKRAWFVVLYSDEGNPETGEKSISKPESQRMSPEQLAWLEETLDRAREAPHVFVFLHHPRWIGRNYGDDWERVHRVLADAGNVKAVFAGHIHRMRYDGPRDGIEYFTLATVGGFQDGHSPAGGYLHHYDLVTVRPDGLSVAAIPVGSALDPRAISGRVSDEIGQLARGLAPRWAGTVELGGDLAAAADLGLAITNPIQRPVELVVEPRCPDGRWSFQPRRVAVRLGPGASTTVALRVERAASPLDASLRLPEVELAVDYVGDAGALALKARKLPLPVAAPTLPTPDPSPDERALVLDGSGAHLRVDSDAFELPDDPFTLEGWLKADDLSGRRAFLCKTESSEYGLFVGNGRPAFYVHLDGDYAAAEAPTASLQAGRWHHVAGAFDGAEVRLYVDGRLAARQAARGRRTRNDHPLFVGADPNGSGQATSFFAGSVDGVRLSRVARYAGERFEPTRRHTPDPDTLLLLDMDELPGPWSYDASPSAAHPLRVGNVSWELGADGD